MEFICFDGETKDNKYFLFGNNTNAIINHSGLTSKECFEFLWSEMSIYKGGYKFIIFRIGFDVNFWIKDMPEQMIKDFIYSKEVSYMGYKLQYYQDKMLIIKRGNKKYKIFDIYNFFQRSFVKVIELLNIDLTKPEREIINLGKSFRTINFQDMKLSQIELYNKTECILASKIGVKIYELMKNTTYQNTYHKDRTLIVSNFYGASAIASKILNDYGFKSESLKMQFKPDSLLKILDGAYYGGRMEALKIGSFNNVYRYDINSAYPTLINELREIISFTFKDYNNEKIINENLYLISFKIFDPELIGLLPFRHSNGMLFFPSDGAGWYYGFEIMQFIKYAKKYFIDYTIFNFYEIILGKKIFNDTIKDLFNVRRELKNANDIRQYIIKITLNSLYGKLAQRTGMAQFLNLYYAGLITSFCRSELLKVSINNYQDIIFFATDGILSKKKLPIPQGINLGEWELKKYDKAIIILSGVYFLINGKVIETARRGYKFDYKKIKKGFIDNKQNCINIKQQLFIGWKYGLKNHIKYKTRILEFVTITKKVTPYSNIKRFFDFGKDFDILKQYNSILISKKDIKVLSKKIDYDKQIIKDEN